MKTAISISDTLFERAERFARQRGLSRSQLYATALQRYIDNWSGDQVTQQINEVCSEVDTTLSQELASESRRTLRKAQW